MEYKNGFIARSGTYNVKKKVEFTKGGLFFKKVNGEKDEAYIARVGKINKNETEKLRGGK